MTLVPRVIELLRARGADEVLVIGGGIIPEADIPGLKALGVAEVFTPGTSLASITDWLETELDKMDSAQESETTVNGS
jgi:methylmalonyl-CoA mutase C-terminal domain/subunit